MSSLSCSHTPECPRPSSCSFSRSHAPALPSSFLPFSLSLSHTHTFTHPRTSPFSLSPSLSVSLSHPGMSPYSILSLCVFLTCTPPPQAHTPKCPLSLSKTLISVKTSPATLPFLSVKAPSLPLNLPPLPTSPHFFSLILHPPSSPPLSFFSPLFLFLNLYDPLLSHSLTW